MGDMGDYYRDWDQWKKERKIKRTQEFRDGWPEIRKRIVAYRCKSDVIHMMLDVTWQKRHIDLWPSTGKWSLDGKQFHTGDSKTFCNFLDNRSKK